MWLGPAWSNKEGEKCSDLGYILKVSFREFASGSDAGRDREKRDSKFFALRFWNGRQCHFLEWEGQRWEQGLLACLLFCGRKNPETNVRMWTENDSRLGQMGVLGKEVTGLGEMRNQGQCPGSAQACAWISHSTGAYGLNTKFSCPPRISR